MDKLLIPFLIFIICNSLNIHAQGTCKKSLNPAILDFENPAEINSKNTDLIFSSAKGYVGTLDSTIAYSGDKSFKIKGIDTANTKYSSIEIHIPVKIEKGSKITVKANIKTQEIKGDNSGATIRILGYGLEKKPGPILFAFNREFLKGTNDWQEISIITPATKGDISKIVLNGTMQGKGNTWFDNFSVLINGKNMMAILEEQRVNISDQELRLLKNYSIGLDSINPTQKGFSDFFADQVFMKKSQIIGIGEATHGTQEIFEFKKLIFKYLVKNMGYRVLALEASLPNAFQLNQYVVHGIGDPITLIRNLEFWMYDTQEFLNIIEWMRKYNESHKDKIYLAGFDMQSSQESKEILRNAFENNKVVSSMLIQLNDRLKQNERQHLLNALKSKIFEQTTDHFIRKNADLLIQQSLLRNASGLKYSTIRDSLMAENVKWLKKVRFPDKKIVLWAHDLHIQKKKGWMGGFLNNYFKDEYTNFGFLLNKGKYTAVNNESRKLSSTNPLSSIPCNSLESVFEKLNSSMLLFNNSEAFKNNLLQASFYKNYFSKRSVGALATNQQFEDTGQRIGELFNFLIYIENSHASKILSDYN